MTKRRIHITPFPLCRIAFLTILLALALPVPAQDDQVITDEDFAILAERIHSFLDESASLMNYIEGAQGAQMESIHHFSDIIDTKWKGFMLLEQEVLSQDDSLMVLVSEYEQTRQQLTDSIAAREKTLQMYADFLRAEKFLSKHIKEYEKLINKAEIFSLTTKTAPQLEELKLREQMLYAEVQQHYDKAKEAAARDQKLQKRMAKIENEYIQIKTFSAKIQEAVYKPFIERIKDYLLSLACVAIMLMLLNMIIARIQAFKQARKAARDMKKMMESQNNDIPTI